MSVPRLVSFGEDDITLTFSLVIQALVLDERDYEILVQRLVRKVRVISTEID